MNRATCALLGLLVGCAASGAVAPTRRAPGDQAPQVSAVTTAGVVVWYPIYLDLPVNARWRSEVLRAVDETAPEADDRIPAGTRGPPPGTVVSVLDPGSFWAPQSATGIARGEWKWQWIHVAMGVRGEAALPALGHELRHAWTQDPKWPGHP